MFYFYFPFLQCIFIKTWFIYGLKLVAILLNITVLSYNILLNQGGVITHGYLGESVQSPTHDMREKIYTVDIHA